jgi:hypothetical protein
MIWLLPHPILRLSHKRDNLLTGGGGRGVGEEPKKSSDGEKAWFSINHSILSDIRYILQILIIIPSPSVFL